MTNLGDQRRLRIRSRDWMVRFHLALRLRMPGVTLDDVISSLVESGETLGGRGVDFRAFAAEYMLRRAQQDAIDRVVTWGLRVFGSETSYRQIYPEYVAEARRRGMVPVPLKSFKNRAKGFVTWGSVIARVEASLK